MLPRLELPPSRVVLVLVALAFTLPGLIGHDPWKTYDAVAIEIINQMHRSGDWLVPRLAGEPWIEDPPLYHWIALMFAKLLGWALPFHGAARLASALCVLIAAWMIYFAARRAAPAGQQRNAGATAMLVLIGSVGLLVHAHEAVPDLASLAAGCGAFAFAALAGQRPLGAGVGLGASLGVAFLSAGPVTPAAIGLAALITPLACAEWRTRRVLLCLGAAVATAALVAASWPIVLAWRAPGLAAQWWSTMLQARGSFGENLRYYLVTASWFAWPAWPLAAWALWFKRREWREPRLFVPAAAFVLNFAALAATGPAQDVNVIVLLVPLALLGAEAVGLLRRGAAAALDWFGVMCFTFFAGLVWLGYLAMMAGVPPKIAHNFAKIAPGFNPQFEALPFLLALALTLGWLYVALFTAPSPFRGVTRWSAGVVLLWGCFATLWLPWADYQKSYRTVALQLSSKVPANAGCIAGQNLGPAQRAALSYHVGLRTEPAQRAGAAGCRLLLVQGHPRDERDGPNAAWSKLADVGRPGDKSERYRLYRLDTP